jgi:transcriptional regulator with XRE-family HTH domain
MKTKIKTKLKAVREAQGLSQSQLSKASGVPLRALQYYEQGKLNFDHCKIGKIFSVALALNCDVEDLLEDYDTIKIIRKYQEA